MHATWEFKSFRPRNPQDRFPIFGRFPLRRSCGPFIGSERDALAFARRACEHLSSKGTLRVEAWSRHIEPPELSCVTFRLKPHTGNRWLTEEGPLAHPG